MPRSSPYTITLSPAEETELRKRVAKYTLPYFQVQRAKMILYAAEGMRNDEIAARLDTRRELVWLWRKRFFADRLAGSPICEVVLLRAQVTLLLTCGLAAQEEGQNR